MSVWFLKKKLGKMKKAFYNYFKEIFDRSLYYGMNYNAHWNRNFEAVSPQASDCASQFITWFNLVNILWKKYEPYWERPPGRRGEAASYYHVVLTLKWWKPPKNATFHTFDGCKKFLVGCLTSWLVSKVALHPRELLEKIWGQ